MGWKIRQIEFEIKEYEYVKEFRISLGGSTRTRNIEITLTLDDGTVGKGEASTSFSIAGELKESSLGFADTVREIVVGEDVRNYRKIFDKLDFALRKAMALKAGVQGAIIDALTKKLGIKMFQFFGGAKNVIETDITIGIESKEEAVKDAKEYIDKGFNMIKAKVGVNWREDAERILAIYDVIKPRGMIVDANQGFSVKEAIMFADVLYREGVNVAIFEQPVKATDIDGLKEVRRSVKFPVAADDAVFSRYDALRLIKEGAVDFINIKLMKSGVSDALAIVEMAKSANVGLMIGCMAESSLGISLSVHFAAGTGAFTYHDLDSFQLHKEEFRGDFKWEGNKYYLE